MSLIKKHYFNDVFSKNKVLKKNILNPFSHNDVLWRMDPLKVEDASTGPISYVNDAGELVTVPAETPIYIDSGYWNIGSFHNYLENPLSPATQTTDTLGVGNYTLWNRGGSVAVSAGTATITGAGVATEGNPLHFAITVAGTVNVTVSGDCTVFQLTGTKFSTYPFLSTSVSTVASRAGTISSQMAIGDKLYSILDGKADGEELLSFSVKPTARDFTTVTTITDGWRITLTSTGKAYGCEWTLTDTPISGDYYEIAVNFSVSGNTHPVYCGINVLRGGTFSYPYDSSPLINRYKVSNDNTFAVVQGPNLGVAGNYIDVTFASIKKISNPNFKLTFKWVAPDNVSVSTTKTILYSGTQPILQFRTDASGNGYIDLKDVTNTASVALDWEYGVSYGIEMLFGNNVAESSNKMQLIVDSTASALTAFDGSLNPDTELTLGKECDYPFFISKPTFYALKQSDWR